MKKLIAILLVLTMLVAVGCTKPTPSETPSASVANNAEAETSVADADKAEAEATEVEPITLKLGTTGAVTGSISQAAVYYSEEVEKASGGKLKIEVIGAGSLGTTAQHYAQLREGSLDIFITALDTGTTMAGGEDFAVCVVPYIFKDQAHFAKFLESDILKGMMDKVSEQNKVHYLGAMGFNFPRGLSCTYPVYSVEDVDNLKIRVPETAAMMRVWEAWGANPQIIASKDLYTSLESKMVDAQENDLKTSVKNSWLEVTTYYMELEYIQQGNILYMASSTWDKLTDEQKGWLEAGRIAAHDRFNADLSIEYESLKEEAIKNGVTFVDADIQSFRDAAAVVAAEMDGELWSAGLYEQIAALAD